MAIDAQSTTVWPCISSNTRLASVAIGPKPSTGNALAEEL